MEFKRPFSDIYMHYYWASIFLLLCLFLKLNVILPMLAICILLLGIYRQFYRISIREDGIVIREFFVYQRLIPWSSIQKIEYTKGNHLFIHYQADTKERKYSIPKSLVIQRELVELLYSRMNSPIPPEYDLFVNKPPRNWEWWLLKTILLCLYIGLLYMSINTYQNILKYGLELYDLVKLPALTTAGIILTGIAFSILIKRKKVTFGSIIILSLIYPIVGGWLLLLRDSNALNYLIMLNIIMVGLLVAPKLFSRYQIYLPLFIIPGLLLNCYQHIQLPTTGHRTLTMSKNQLVFDSVGLRWENGKILTQSLRKKPNVIDILNLNTHQVVSFPIEQPFGNIALELSIISPDGKYLVPNRCSIQNDSTGNWAYLNLLDLDKQTWYAMDSTLLPASISTSNPFNHLMLYYTPATYSSWSPDHQKFMYWFRHTHPNETFTSDLMIYDTVEKKSKKIYQTSEKPKGVFWSPENDIYLFTYIAETINRDNINIHHSILKGKLLDGDNTFSPMTVYHGDPTWSHIVIDSYDKALWINTKESSIMFSPEISYQSTPATAPLFLHLDTLTISQLPKESWIEQTLIHQTISRELFFQRKTNSNSELWGYDIKTGKSRKIVSTGKPVYSVQYTTDGRRIIFTYFPFAVFTQSYFSIKPDGTDRKIICQAIPALNVFQSGNYAYNSTTREIIYIRSFVQGIPYDLETIKCDRYYIAAKTE